ncbi:recombinase family protein [Paraburkholderia sp. MM5477-R1]|uniref:recombinase family protein n=1 Tax=Paraburkholderia sp. MM5477-R1 TaxID=2991062 RepID=UPI003D1940D8
MTNVDRLPELLLKRKAVVYVRGFRDVEVIDDDMGRSASGAVARPGFERLVALLCAGEVGAVLCMDASRLARNGRDWHHLLELCR